MNVRILVFLVLTSASAQLSGAGSSGGRTEQETSISLHAKARQSLEAYGVKSWFIAVRGQGQSMLTQLDGIVAPGYYDVLVSAVRRGLEPDPLFELCVSRFAERIEKPHLDIWIDWLRTPAVQSIVREENRADAASQADRDAYIETLIMTPPTIERTALIERLERALDATNLGFEMYALGRDALLAGMRQSVPDSPPVQAQSELVGLSDEEIALVTELTRQDLLFRYGDVPDAVLEDYASFWESAHGRTIHDALIESVVEALRSGYETTGRLFGEQARPYIAASGDPNPPGMPQVFENGNFSFSAPADMAWAPWNAELNHPGANAGYIRSAPEMYLYAAAESLDAVGMELSMDEVAALIRSQFESVADSYQLVYQEPHNINGFDGLLLSSQVNAIGQTFKYLHWVYIRNGYVYQLVSYAREATPDDEFLALAEGVFSGFQLLKP